MDNLQSYYAKEFARFYRTTFPNMSCKSVPKSLDDLNFTETTTLQDWEGGVLYQNLFRDTEKLPADVLVRHLDGGKYHVGDQEALRAAGFTADAARVEGEIAAARQLMRENELAEITARNEARDKARLEESRIPKNIGFNDPSAVKARRDWGLSDDIGIGA